MWTVSQAIFSGTFADFVEFKDISMTWLFSRTLVILIIKPSVKLAHNFSWLFRIPIKLMVGLDPT